MIRFADLDAGIRSHLDYNRAEDALLDPRGQTVRCTPWRRTKLLVLPDGRRLFLKSRYGHLADARAEWYWCGELEKLGYLVPRRLFFAQLGRHTALGVLAVEGRPLDALLAQDPDAVGLAIRLVAPLVRRLHDEGLVYRDLYWSHLFLNFLDCRRDGENRIALIDLERVFRPRLRRSRWIVKDLAGLLSSLPAGCQASRTDQLRFLRAYLGKAGPLSQDSKLLVRRILRKARQIRRHRPKYP